MLFYLGNQYLDLIDVTSTEFSLVSCSSLKDLPDRAQARVDSGSIRAPPSGNDCVCLVKQYMGSAELAQPPLLILTEARARRVGLVPSERS